MVSSIVDPSIPIYKTLYTYSFTSKTQLHASYSQLLHTVIALYAYTTRYAPNTRQKRSSQQRPTTAVVQSNKQVIKTTCEGKLPFLKPLIRCTSIITRSTKLNTSKADINRISIRCSKTLNATPKNVKKSPNSPHARTMLINVLAMWTKMVNSVPHKEHHTYDMAYTLLINC